MEQSPSNKTTSKLDGKILTCFKCQSQHHFANHCDAEEVALHVEVVRGTENIVLISGEMSMFTWEARGAAVLDSCCSSIISKSAMKAAGISINFKDDEIEAFGKKAPLF